LSHQIISLAIIRMSSTTTTTNTKPLLNLNDAFTKFIVDGGSWADAMSIQASLDIPILEAKLKAAVKKQNPSGERYRAKLLAELRSAYADTPGKKSEDADTFLADALAAYEAEKAAKKAAKAGTATPAKAKATPKDAWVLLDVDE
jgi:hypothetical protein